MSDPDTLNTLPWYQRTWRWFTSLFVEEYELKVWYVYETNVDPRGMKTVKRKQQIYYLKDIKKRSNTHIIGIDMYNKRVEIKTIEPFDYEIRQIK